MTHGFLNRFGEERRWQDLLESGVTHLEAVAVDWIFGTTTTPPVTGGWWEHRRRRRMREEEELLLL